MLTIDKNGNIKFNRGDTFEVPLFIDINTNIFKSTRLKWKAGDKVYFHVLENNKPFECPLFGKEFTYEDVNENNDIIVKFNHKDTNWLFPGTYYYEVKLSRPSDREGEEPNILTIVPRRKIIIQ